MQEKINQITKILRDCSYEQTAYIIKTVRERLNLKQALKPSITQPISVEDFGRILGTAYTMSGVKGLMIKTLFLGGFRANEFVNLKIEFLDYNNKTIFIDVAKKESQRHVPLLPSLVDELKTFIGDRKKGYIFQSQKINGTGTYRYSTARIWQIVKEIAKISKVETEHKKIYPHKFRHTIATFLLSKGVPLDEIQKMLGHKNITTTQIYAKTDITKLQQDYNNAFSVNKMLT